MTFNILRTIVPHFKVLYHEIYWWVWLLFGTTFNQIEGWWIWLNYWKVFEDNASNFISELQKFWKSFIFAQLQTKFSKLHFLRHLQLRNWFYPVLSLSTKQPRPLNWEGNRMGPYQCAHFKLIDTSLYQTPIRKYIWPIGKAKQLRWYLTTAIIYKKWLT